MKKILSVNKGKTHCDWCPFTAIMTGDYKTTINIEHCRKYINLLLGIDCKEYDLSTLKVVNNIKKI